MKKSTAVLLASLVFILMAGMAIAAAHHGPENIMINEAAAKKPGVEFPHWKHQDMVPKCTTCHHTDKGLSASSPADVKVEKCSACHLDPKDPEMPSMRQMSMKKNPFHMKCIGCHREEAKGPTRCADCHKKAS